MATTILALVRFTSLLVWNASGRENSTSFPSNFLGQYSLDPFFEQYVPIGGLSYFFSAPPAFMDTLLHDPVSTIFHGIIFGAIFLGLYISMTKLMFQIGGRITNTPQEQNIDERWLYIGILCVIADLLNVLAVGLGIILLALILANYYQLITSGRSLEFVRFDLEGPEKKELGIKDRIQLTKGKYTLVVILIGLGIFLLRFIAFVILGREI